MEKKGFTRRKFLTTVSAGSVGVVASSTIPLIGNTGKSSQRLAILGGEPVRKNKVYPNYMDLHKKKIVDLLTKTTNSERWQRSRDRGYVYEFENEWAKLTGTKHAHCVNSGTSALNTCVEALGIGAGDEIITTPYSDMGTISSIIMARALPVMADLDPESCQLDPEDVERRITRNTKAIMPVHIHGVSCDMERIMDIAKRHNLRVIEDACQAHLSEFDGKKVGSIGDLGAFSFNFSKAINCGEGGVVVGNDEHLMNMAHTYIEKGYAPHLDSNTLIKYGPKYRMHEFEGSVLMGQLPGAIEQFETRNRNAEYLNSRLREIPGIVPQKLYKGTGRSTIWNYTAYYHKEHFNNVPRSNFLRALRAEGITMGSYIGRGFHRQGPWHEYMLNMNEYKNAFSRATLRRYRDEFSYPNCDKVCDELLLSFRATHILLGTRADMDDIANAVAKVYENRDRLSSI